MTGLVPVHDRTRLRLLCDDAAASLPLGAGRGLIVGTMFDRSSGATVAALSEADRREVSRSRGKSLITSLWGGYLAFIMDEAADRLDVVRDPGGALPAYMMRDARGTFVASDVALLVAVGLCVSIDREFLGHHLALPQMRTSQTGLVGVVELLPGQRLAVAETGSDITTIWSPWSFACSDVQYRDPAQAREAVRTAVRQAVASWASQAGHIVLGVSGGLDSSIVAACLKDCSASFSLYTLVTTDPIGDERRYARILADHLGAALAECAETTALVDIRRSEAAHLPRPVARSFAQSGNRHGVALAERVGAGSFFSGGGGDSVFCYLNSTAPLVDRLRAEGLGGGWMETARDVARLTEVSLYQVVRTMIPKLISRDSRYRWPCDMRFLNGAATPAPGEGTAHPWYGTPRGASRGKAAHVAWLLGIQNYLEGFDHERRFPIHFPLMAQPVVEACLRVPSWMWCAGGRNRAVARDAFRDLLPAQILGRRSKGSFDGLVREIFDGNRPIIREMLLDGCLVGWGLLDRGEIERALERPDEIGTLDCARLIGLVDVEAWVAVWSGRAS